MLLIKSKALLFALAIFFSTTTAIVSSLVISNSGEIPEFQDLNNFSLEDVSEDVGLPFTEVDPTTSPKLPESSSLRASKISVSCRIEDGNEEEWWKSKIGNSGDLTLNDLRERLCGLVDYLKWTNTKNISAQTE